MCGIAGYSGTRELDPGRIERCLALMRHRGPDAAAHRHWLGSKGRHTHLLHTRLTIIDFDERANQPFHFGSKWLCANGELYNYVEVRAALATRGLEFRTTSDTEVLAVALAQDGWNALDACEGMWAFALYDEADGSLGLCRDRFGEKPLYYLRTDDGLFFGSEAKFVAALAGRRLEPNVDHVYRYLVNGYKALYKRPATFFLGLEEVPPGSVLQLDAGGAEAAWRYLDPGRRPSGRRCRTPRPSLRCGSA